MKKLYYLIVLALILGLVLTGCLLSNVGQVPTTGQSGISYLTKHTADAPDVFSLLAGQTIPVGTVSVWNGINVVLGVECLYVKYETTDGWVMTETHLAVAPVGDNDHPSSEDIPQTKKDNPIPGQFPYQCCYNEDATQWVFEIKEGNTGAGCDADGNPVATLTEILYTIPLNGWNAEDELYIAAHAVVVKASDELVANGSFELPTVARWAVFPTGYSDLEWTVEPTDGSWDVKEGLELQRIWTPNSELQYAELDAYKPVKIYQNLSTWPEGRCTLTYAWSPCPGVSENIMEVWWDGKRITTHSADGSSNANTIWEVETYIGLVPNASSPTHLMFVDVEQDIPHSYGMFLDSVSVVCVQEETAWADGFDFEGKNWATYFKYTVQPALTLDLYEKDPSDWSKVIDGAWGELKYYPCGFTFDFVFNGHGLVSGWDYTLIYYPDPWPGTGLICLGSGIADGSGDVSFAASVNTGDLPAIGDDNYPDGAKIWLVLSDDIDCGVSFKNVWNPTEYLFENNLITFDDVDVP